MSVEAWAVVVSVLVALIGYALKHLHDLHLARRKDRLDRVSRQLSELYGPLFALNAAAGRLRKEFMNLHAPSSEAPTFWGSGQAPTLEQAEAWRLWMTTVFMPLNVEMRDRVVDHADLLEDSDGMPACLLDLCAHVAGHETVLEGWRSGNFDPRDPDDNRSVIKYPAPDLGRYVETTFFKPVT